MFTTSHPRTTLRTTPSPTAGAKHQPDSWRFGDLTPQQLAQRAAQEAQLRSGARQ